MANFRVLITDHPWPDLDVERDGLSAVGAELLDAPAQDEATLVELARGVDAIITTWASTTAAVINASARLQVVSRMGIGLDNIDVSACSARGVPVTNVPSYCESEVAEHALALLFALGRQVAFHHALTKSGEYDLQAGPPLSRLQGQTVGVIGLGNIGRRLAEKCLAVGFHVLAVRRGDLRAPGIEYADFDEVMRRSDYISLHTPLTAETEGMIGRRQFAQMKPTAFLINTARGGLVDHDALAAALADGELAGAALDVQTPEPPDLSRPPYNDARVIVTPHIAFVSQQSL
ncbi:MAG: C-terminal binding protein, partial [Pirellulaceae bacterium]|nr:C-terminal binding protein [Pirellulaceae bacterium]